MSKPIKSGVRKLLFTMLSKHNAVKTEERKFILEKEKLLSEIVDVSESNESDLASTRIKELVAKIKEIDSQKSIANETNFLKKISFLTGISESSLWRIKKEGAINEGQWDTPGKKRPRQATKSNLDDFDITAIRNKINEFYNVKKQVPTLRRLHGELKEAISFSGCLETLRQVLHKNGYEFKKNLNERALLIERHDIAAWRHRYLRTIAQKRSEGKTIVYIDETYVHQNYKVKKSWQGPLIWSLAKRKIASRNVKQCAPEMEALINESFLSITPAEWKSCTNYVINVENEYKSRDRISENLEPFIINLNDDDDEQSFEDIQYLESDSDF